MSLTRGPFWAIVGDTWRQSKHQIVLLLLIILLGASAPALCFFVEVREAPDGSLFLCPTDAPEGVQRGYDQGWEGAYADTLKQEIGFRDLIFAHLDAESRAADAVIKAGYAVDRLVNRGADAAEIEAARDEKRALEMQLDELSAKRRDLEKEERSRVDRTIEQRTGRISRLQKGVEAWLGNMASYLFLISMLGFIAACSAYVPAMIEAGSIDLVLSKPIRRWHLYFGKYVGGMLLYSLMMLGCYVEVFVVMGVRTGVWHWPFFNALPMTVFSAGLLYALIGWVGLWTRSAGLAMVVGYTYYLVVDTAVGLMGDPMVEPLIRGVKGFKELVEFTKLTFPSFRWLREAAESGIYSVFVMPWKHVIVGLVWLVVCLGTAFNRFRINDY